MKQWLTVLLLETFLLAWADQGRAEASLSVEKRARLLTTLAEALRDGDITSQQHEQARRWVNSTPCAGIDHGLTAAQKSRFEAAISRQQKLEKVSVSASFRKNGWYILSSEAGVGDSPHFFYSTNPANGARPLAIWSGGASIFDTTEVAGWVRRNASGIPAQLADCFAWQVTLDRE